MKRTWWLSLFIMGLLVPQFSPTRATQGPIRIRPTSALSASPIRLGTVESVIWTNLMNCVAAGGTLQKIAGRNDTTDAGANSVQQITAGDGYLEFTALETNKERYVGLTRDYAGTSQATIDYAIHLTAFSYRGGMVAEVRENGVYKTETSYRSGTVFRIAVESDVVKYYRDGGLFYTSQVKPSYPLVADAALLNLNATISNALISTPKDTTPPIISAIISSYITASEAVITWTTNEAADTQVEYGLTTSYGNLSSQKPLGANHRVTLIGLQPNTLYHYRVKSADGAGNLASSKDFTLKTLAIADTTPPVLSAITSSEVTTNSVMITWLSNEVANSQVEYGLTTAYGNSRALAPLELTHRVALIGLTPNTFYHYRVKSADAAANQSASGDFLFKTATAGETTAGMLDDGQVHLPAYYTNFPAPSVGVSFKDSAFGAMITRLSDGLAQFNDGVHHEYSSMSPFNLNSSRILLATHRSGYYIVDRAGNIILNGSALGIGNSAEPRWSLTNPNVFYFHEDNQLKKFELTTQQKSVVRTFTQYNSINFGGGEADISDDGDHLVIVGDDRYVGLYTFSTNTLGLTLDTYGLGGFDYFDVTPDNNVIARWGAQGAGRYKGFELFDQNMRFLRQVATFGAHADRARDLDGAEVLIVAAYNDTQPPLGCEHNGIEKVRLSDGRRTCLLGLDWNAEIHVSANSTGKKPWVLVSTTDVSSGTATATLAFNWQNIWKARYNEVILVKLDGSETRRLAHHRSRKLDDYWFMPRATISRDGKYALFDSNLGAKPLADYSDSFLVNLTNPLPLP